MGSHHVPDFEALIARIAQALQDRSIPFMLIGGQAVLLHAEPRLTQVIDITLGVTHRPPRGDPEIRVRWQKRGSHRNLIPDRSSHWRLPCRDSACL